METLHTDTDNFLVILDSRNAIQYINDSWNSAIKFNFENAIRLKNHSIKMTCSVFSFTCPNSIYIINETNSLLSLTINDTIGTTTTYIIKYGNYNASTFITQLITQIGSNFNVTLDTINNTFTITNYIYNFTINSTSTIYNIMGFAKNTSYTSTLLTLILPYTCNFNGTQSININFANLNTSNIDSFNETTSSIIQSIPIDCTLQQISFNKTSNFAFNISQDTIDYIQIEIKDDLENFINFNNQHWNLTLYFSQTKDYDRFHYQKDFDSILTYGNNLYE